MSRFTRLAEYVVALNWKNVLLRLWVVLAASWELKVFLDWRSKKFEDWGQIIWSIALPGICLLGIYSLYIILRWIIAGFWDKREAVDLPNYWKRKLLTLVPVKRLTDRTIMIAVSAAAFLLLIAIVGFVAYQRSAELTYTVQAPNGKIVKVRASKSLTEAEVIDRAKRSYSKQYPQ